MRSELIVKLRLKPSAALRPTGSAFSPAFLTKDPITVGFHELLVAEGLTARPLRSGTQASGAAAATIGFARSESPHRTDAYMSIGDDGKALEPLRSALAKLPEIEAVYVIPVPEVRNADVAVAAPRSSPTPDFRSKQGYLDPAAGGIDAAFAWTVPGGRGEGISLIDIEGDWVLDHESLTGKTMPALSLPADPGANWGSAHEAFLQHGTSVLGELVGNGTGVTGIASAVSLGVVSHQHAEVAGQPLGAAGAIVRATDLLKAGDVLLLEMHMPGPRYGFTPRDDQLGYIAVEWWEPILDAIRDATDKGIIVVEAAGNGREGLDDSIYDRGDRFSASWKNPFRREQDASCDSGAILVGAGAPPSGAFGADASRLDFSNFGNAVDAQGWGREVTSCGYGDLQGGTDWKRWYTAEFAGTSSASPMVAGALACVQGALLAKGLPLLTPATARKLLRSTGTPQPAPARDRVGNRPDLRQMITEAIAQAGSAV